MATGIPVSVGELVDTPTINTWARGYLRKNTAKAINNTVAASDLLNGEFTIPAGALSTDKVLRLTVWGDWIQNTTVAQSPPAFQLRLGSTTLIDTGAGGAFVAKVNSRFGWRFVCEIQNLGATNSQQAFLEGGLVYTSTGTGGVNANFVTGNGVTYSTDPGGTAEGTIRFIGGNTGLAVDTTASQGLAFRVYNGVASVNYETKLYGALVEII